MSSDIESKKQAIADFIDGQVIDASSRVAVCTKGAVLGLPVTLEAINTGWPFGVMYSVETNITGDPHSEAGRSNNCKITIYPRMGRGLMGIFTKLLLFEASGSPIGDKRLEKVFNFSYDDRAMAEKFVCHPGVADKLLALEDISKFSEIVINTSLGIYLAQPTPFSSLELDSCQSTILTLAQLGQILFEAF